MPNETSDSLHANTASNTNTNGRSTTTTNISTSTPPSSTGLLEYLIFLGALLSGTACSICSKSMMQMHGRFSANEDTIVPFSKPIFQTFGMFVGMMLGLVMHGAVLYWRLPFPGYAHRTATAITTTSTTVTSTKTTTTNGYGSIPTPTTKQEQQQQQSTTITTPSTSIPTSMYWFLAIPSIFDLLATALCMMGLQYLPVSMYQLLRGSGIIFVALLKQYWLDHALYTFQWLGVAYNVIAVVLVSLTAVLATAMEHDDDSSSSTTTDADDTGNSHQALLGVTLVLLGAWVQALQFVVEERVMNLDDVSIPPLLLIGMEGVWGTVLCVLVVYPLTSYVLPGTDYHGSYEHWYSTWELITHTPSLQTMVAVYSCTILSYNVLAVLVTFLLNSVWHAILDNFRPLTVWAAGLGLYYWWAGNGSMGEPWTPGYSWLQVAGMGVLLYGTAVYNAPNAGSIALRGQWYAMGWDCTEEYEALEEEMVWEERKLKSGDRRASSLAELSPFMMQQTLKRKQQQQELQFGVPVVPEREAARLV